MIDGGVKVWRDGAPEDGDELAGEKLRSELLHLSHVTQQPQHVTVQLLFIWKLLRRQHTHKSNHEGCVVSVFPPVSIPARCFWYSSVPLSNPGTGSCHCSWGTSGSYLVFRLWCSTTRSTRTPSPDRTKIKWKHTDTQLSSLYNQTTSNHHHVYSLLIILI